MTKVGQATQVLLFVGRWRSWLRLEMRTQDDGLRLLNLLGIAPSQSSTSFVLPSLLFGTQRREVGALIANTLVWGIYAAVAPASWGLAGTPLAVAAWVVVQALSRGWPARARVGSDGVHVRWILFERFLNHSTIEGATLRQWGSSKNPQYSVHMAIADGSTFILPGPRMGPDAREQGLLLALRIRECGFVQASAVLSDALGQLDRGARSVREWLLALETLTLRSDYRTAAVTPRQLVQILDDPRCSPVMRGAAAIALAGKDRAVDHGHLGEVASTTAHDGLRRLLQAMADGASSSAKEAQFLALVQASAWPSECEREPVEGPAAR